MKVPLLNVSLVLIGFLLLDYINGEFPNDPQPCKYEDADCLIKLINHLMNDKYEGDDALNLMPIDPLLVKSARILQGEESPVNVDLIFTNNYIYGWKNAKVLKVKGFGQDMTKKHELLFHVDNLSLVGAYTIDGKILILPIKGSGESNITMVDVKIKMDFVGAPLEKDGATYMSIDKFNLDAEPNSIIFKVENLFNGDKALSDQMNMFLNENWQDIYAEVRVSLSEAFVEIYSEVIKRVFTKYPYEKFFAEA